MRLGATLGKVYDVGRCEYLIRTCGAPSPEGKANERTEKEKGSMTEKGILEAVARADVFICSALWRIVVLAVLGAALVMSTPGLS